MLHLTYSNRTEELLAQLGAHLAAARARGRSPLEPVPLIVPNGNIETFVKLGLAEAEGIAANLEVSFLRRFVEELVARSHPEVRLLDAGRLEGLLLALFHDEALLADGELAEVRAWLGAGGASADALDLRRCQLARKLALLFDEYALSRAELLEGWLRGRTLFPDGPKATIERWQRRLWRELAGEGGRLARRAAARGERWPTLAAFFREVDPRELEAPAELYLFGISYVAPAFQQVLRVLAHRSELYVYTLNPCMEFWEDVPHGHAPRAPLPRRSERGIDLEAVEDPFHLEDAPADTPALRLWGRPGREHIRLLNELSDCDFQPRFVDPAEARARPTLLAELQRDILLREPEREAPDADAPAEAQGDGSLQILICPSIRREAEIIAAEIWKLARADRTLRWNQIAVIVPGAQKELYQTHLQAVFRELEELPCSVADLPLAVQSRVPEAIELLLALPLGELKRAEVLSLITHPAVMARFPDATPDDWRALTDALGVVHGADHGDHAGTYIEHDILNWDQGVRRLALGSFMIGRGRRSGAIADAPAFPLDGELYLPEEPPRGQAESAAEFGLLVRALVADVRFAKQARLELPAWVAFLRGWVNAIVGAPGDEDERVLGRCLQALSALEDLDLDGQRVGYRVACELYRAQLAGLSGSRGQYLADGVVIASFVPMRAVPFRVVFVAGLGEGQFPSGDRLNHLDLRQGARRRPGDVTPREQDKYMFLETLLCARERLYLSYVAREPLTGDPRSPSSVIIELERILERGYRPREVLEKTVYRRFKLRRHDDEHTLTASLPAEREAKARALGHALREHAGPEATGDLAALRRGLSPEVWGPLEARLGLCPPPPEPVADGAAPEVLHMPLAALRKFLECPLQGAARYLLGLREEEDDDPSAREDEAFAASRLHLVVGLREAFWRAAGRDGSGLTRAALAAEYEAFRARAERLGVLPTGLFGAIERSGHLRVLDGWAERLRERAAGRPLRLRALRFGRAEEHARVDELYEAIELEVEAPLPGGGREKRIVRLHGRTETRVDLGDGESGSLVLLNAGGDDAKNLAARLQKEQLKPFLDHVALAAAGQPLPADGFHGWVLNAVAGRPTELDGRHHPPLGRAEARAWLKALIEDLLAGPHDYLLPCDAVFQHHHDPTSSVRELVEKMREKEELGASRFGPVPRPESYPPPPEARARELIARRFGLFFAGSHE